MQARGSRLVGAFGWVLSVAGAVVLLYVVYVLFWTGLGTSREQSSMLEQWETTVGEVEEATVRPGVEGEAGEPAPPERDDVVGTAPEVGDAVAVVAFRRQGTEATPVTDDHLVVVEGVGYSDLQRGPGHYPGTAMPGEDGNFAVAGHRVTYGAPFHRLDELRDGDEIHVWDRQGEHYVYAIRDTAIVAPSASWVIGRDPLETAAPTITLTTCHPRYSNRERMIAFGELVS